MRHTFFLFGEAEKGEFCTPHLCKSLPQLEEIFGNPPKDSLGIFYAIQALLYERELIFFRVKEEGYSLHDYMKGIQILQNQNLLSPVSAICLPGVGDFEIIEPISSLCAQFKSLLIMNEKDMYDYLTISYPAK